MGDQMPASETVCPAGPDDHSLIQAIPDLIFINGEDGTYLSCHVSDPRQLYVPLDSFLHRTIAEVLPKEIGNEFLKAFRTVRQTGGVQEFCYRLEVSGTLQIFEARVAVCSPGSYISIVRNVTRQRAIEEAIKQDAITLKAILASTADGILAIGSDRKVLHFNDRFASIWKIPSELLKSRDDVQLLNHVLAQLVDPAGFLSKVEQLYQTDSEDADLLQFKDGRIIERFSIPMILDGAIEGRVWSFRDISDRIAADAQRHAIERQGFLLRRAESLGRMASSIAHHFNNKLQAVLGSLEVLARQDLDRRFEDQINTAKSATENAAEISRQLATYLGQPLDGHRTVDLNSAIQAWLSTFKTILPASLQVDFAPVPESLWVNVHGDRFNQALACLISNAVDSMSPLSGNLSIRTGLINGSEIQPQFRMPVQWLPTPTPYAFVSLGDNGTGIPAESMDSVCEPFFSSKDLGRGLGLPVSIGILDAHGGGLRIQSAEGKGTEVTLFLPLVEVAMEGLPTLPPNEALPEGHSRKTILLIDDDELILMATGAMIEELGYDLVTANGGHEGVQLFEKHRYELLCVISDLTMPEMDGWQTIEAIRRIDPDAPIILSSGFDKAHVMAEEAVVKPNAFLWKPYDLQTLCKELDRIALIRTGQNN